MDLLTQGLLGAAVAQSCARKHEARIATGIGMASGLLPDADVLITSASDPLLFLDFHRHFTHALLSVPFVALVAALVAWFFVRKRLSFARTWLYALLGCLFAGSLDALTSYGTHLLWPFSAQPIALGVVSIVDPVVTLSLAVGLFLGWRLLATRPSRFALLAVVVYLGLGFVQHQRAQSAADELAAGRGHSPQRALVKPTIANLLLWRSLYVVDGRIHADAIRVSPFGEVTVYPGESALLVDAQVPIKTGDAAAALNPVLMRFSGFATGLLVRHCEREGMIGDARFAMLPTSLKPLWGIVPAATSAAYPAEFVTDRTMSAAERDRFVGMLLGRQVR